METEPFAVRACPAGIPPSDNAASPASSPLPHANKAVSTLVCRVLTLAIWGGCFGRQGQVVVVRDIFSLGDARMILG